MTLKHILLVTDFSDEAERAFEPTAELARRTGAQVTVLHVALLLTETTQTSHLADPVVPPNWESDRKEAEEALLEHAKALPEDVDWRTRVETGTQAASTIARFAEENDVDLIAMSTHGRSGLRRMVLGSVAENVLRHVKCSVLCFPPPDPDHPVSGKMGHVFLATDEPENALAPFRPALDLAKVLSSRMTVMHMVPDLYTESPTGSYPGNGPSPEAQREVEVAQQEMEDSCSGLAEELDVEIEAIVGFGTAPTILEEAQARGADWIAMSTHGRRGLARLALGSITEEVLRHSTLPVFCVHRPEGS